MDVDWIVDIADQSIIRQLTMDCSADIVKQAQVGVPKSGVLQPRKVFHGIKKFEMPHFHFLNIIIGPMQKIRKKCESNQSRTTYGYFFTYHHLVHIV